MPSWERLCIYISLILLIILLIILKRRLEVSSRVGRLTITDILEEKFTNSSFQVELTSGPNIVVRINNNDILAPLPNTIKKDNAMYILIVKVDGTPRIIESYQTGSNKESSNTLLLDLQRYFDKSKLLDDKYLFVLTKNTSATYLDDNVKNFFRTNLKATKINDIINRKPYLLIYDLIDNNVRTEQLGSDGGSETFKDILFATSRSLQYNKDGLLVTSLQCYLDATRKESYSPEFGYRWKDISGNNRHFDWAKPPIFGDGQMLNTIKTGEAKGPNGNTFGLGDGSQGYAIILYSKTNSLRNSHAFVFEGVPNFYGIQSHITWGDNTVYFDQGWPYTGTGRNRVQVYQPDWAEYHVWAFVRAFDGSMKIYKDGNLIVSGVAGGCTPLNLKATPVRLNIGWDANISKFLVYNTHLMPEDVKRVSNWIISDEKKQRDLRMKAQLEKVPNSIPIGLGLQCYLDSRNYTAGSLEWKDMSGNGYDFKWSSAPQIENGSILLSRGEYALSKKGSRMLNIDSKDTYTICWTGKTNQLSANVVFKIMGNNYLNRGIFAHPTWVSNQIFFDQAGCCDDNRERVYGDVSKFSKDYAFYCIRKTNNERAIYVNGIKLYTRNTSGSPININDEPMIIGRDLQQNYTWYGNLKNFMVYNRDLSDSEIRKLYEKAFSPYEFTKNTYDESEQFCRKRGMKLCKADEYCSNNKAVYPLDTNTWAPISDYPNGWIQVGPGGEMCKTHKQRCEITKDATCDPDGNPTWADKKEREIGILCCDSKYQPLLINAIYRVNEGNKTKLFFFKNKSYQTIEYKDNKVIDVSKVQSINTFKGLSRSFANGNIDAISITKNPNESLWFIGKNVMVYDDKKQIGSEMLISEYFKNLSDDFKGGFLDAVATRGPNTDYILFKKNRYCIVDMTSRTKSSEGLITAFSTLPQDFKLGFLDCAAYSNKPNCSYLFKNDKFVEYNFANKSIVKGPANISTEFGYLLPPFSAKNELCNTYERLSKLSKYWMDKYYKECKKILKKEYDVNLNTYKGLVDKYSKDLNKSKKDSKSIKEQVDSFAKALEKKRNEMIQLENKLLDIKSKPCKKDDICTDKKVKRSICTEEVQKTIIPSKINKKQIIIKEKDIKEINPKYYEIDSRNVEKCYYDPDVGKDFEGGFNFFKHPKVNDYVPITSVKQVNDFDIKEHPDYANYIPKNKIPKQRTAKDFDITEHPDYNKYKPKNKK